MLHVLTKTTPPDLRDTEIALTLKGLGKKMFNRVKQAQPFTPEILLDILPYLDLTKRSDLVFWAILLVGFFGMLRKSNLMPNKADSFDPSKQLTRSHITFRNNIAILNITWAKNLQFKQKVLEIPLLEIPNSPLCPVTVLKAVLARKGKAHYPLFRTGKRVEYTYSQFQTKLCKVLKKAGYRSQAFSSHSMRRGAVMWAYRSGVPESLIQIHGDWSSEAYKRYLEFPVEMRALVSLKMREKILSSLGISG